MAAFRLQKEDKPDDGCDNLFEPSPGTGSIKGSQSREALQSSFYTKQSKYHPRRKQLMWAALGAGLLMLVRRSGIN